MAAVMSGGQSVQAMEERRRLLAKEIESMRREREKQEIASAPVGSRQPWVPFKATDFSTLGSTSPRPQHDRSCSPLRAHHSTFRSSEQRSAASSPPHKSSVSIPVSPSQKQSGGSPGIVDSRLSAFPHGGSLTTARPGSSLADNSAHTSLLTSSAGELPSFADSSDRTSAEISKRLNHVDLIARAREIAKETADAIDRAKASMERSSNTTRMYASSGSQSAAAIAQVQPAAASTSAPQPTASGEQRSNVLASTLAVAALRSTESSRSKLPAASHQEAPLRSPGPAIGTQRRHQACEEVLSGPPHGRCSAVPISPRPQASQRGSSPTLAPFSPGRRERHPDLHWGATALAQPAQTQQQQWSPRLNVTAYPPSPEDLGRTFQLADSTIGKPWSASPRSLHMGLDTGLRSTRSQRSPSPQKGYVERGRASQVWSPRQSSSPAPMGRCLSPRTTSSSLWEPRHAALFPSTANSASIPATAVGHEPDQSQKLVSTQATSPLRKNVESTMQCDLFDSRIGNAAAKALLLSGSGVGSRSLWGTAESFEKAGGGYQQRPN